MSEEEQKKKEGEAAVQQQQQQSEQPSEQQPTPTENYVKLQPKPGARAIDNPNVTPENFREKAGEYTPLVPGLTPDQAQRNRELNQQSLTGPAPQNYTKTLQDIQAEQEEHKRDVALIKQANDKLGTTDKQFTELIDEARARRIRQMAMHDVVLVPMHQKKEGDNNLWFNPFSKKWEQDYKREGEDKDAWIIRPFKRYAIDKQSWDEAAEWQAKMALLPPQKLEERRQMDIAWVQFLGYKFFAMTPDDIAVAKWDVLKDYIMSCLYRTNVGLPYYPTSSDDSLAGNNPIR